MKRTFGWVGITTVALCISLEAASVAAHNQPSVNIEALPTTNLLAQRRLPLRQLRNQQALRVPIQSRAGGVPVLAVTFNGGRSFPMLLDTGASVTTITPQMAKALRFKQEDTIKLTIANGQTVEVPFGTVPSMEIGGLVINDFQVAVTEAPLLGQNFHGHFNVIIGKDMVIFRPRPR
jgi:aspartyl protease family protein